ISAIIPGQITSGVSCRRVTLVLKLVAVFRIFVANNNSANMMIVGVGTMTQFKDAITSSDLAAPDMESHAAVAAPRTARQATSFLWGIFLRFSQACTCPNKFESLHAKYEAASTIAATNAMPPKE